MRTKPILVACVVLLLVTLSCGIFSNCDSSYEGVCIPPPPPDLNCDDIQERNFKVVGPDHHGFDGDNDGLACE